jgi:small subunit ribosomal protein S4
MTAGRIVPKWLDYDANNFTGTVIANPTREDIDVQVKEHLIVEFYSK